MQIVFAIPGRYGLQQLLLLLIWSPQLTSRGRSTPKPKSLRSCYGDAAGFAVAEASGRTFAGFGKACKVEGFRVFGGCLGFKALRCRIGL